jgi:hypothetical protein
VEKDIMDMSDEELKQFLSKNGVSSKDVDLSFEKTMKMFDALPEVSEEEMKKYVLQR